MLLTYKVVEEIRCETKEISFRIAVAQYEQRQIFRNLSNKVLDLEAHFAKLYYYLSRGYNDTKGNETRSSNDVFVYHHRT